MAITLTSETATRIRHIGAHAAPLETNRDTVRQCSTLKSQYKKLARIRAGGEATKICDALGREPFSQFLIGAKGTFL